ncbi:MAG: bifunctional hydroxymethylpyrimidine kinase/phosphomethylpyrimidine kinase [Bryobacterales bacterium]|nr:bifunctional hydroxymethylpyrimidine kinase/phosphomethylpyrimidine kinase [Bryobacterales bacterium]
MLPAALTIAGSDPSGGAGLQADLKTFHQLGVYGMSVVTLLTVQNTVTVESVDPLEPDYVRRQLAVVCADIPPAAAKTGALGEAGIIEVVAQWAAQASCPLVVDPVMISKHGKRLMAADAREALTRQLLPHCALVTPNTPEAEDLAAIEIRSLEDAREAGRRILDFGPAAVLVKGGHLETGKNQAVDVLVTPEGEERFVSQRYQTRHTHGAGCTYSAAITAGLAKGLTLGEAVAAAKRFVSEAIATAPGLGAGAGPLNHHAE